MSIQKEVIISGPSPLIDTAPIVLFINFPSYYDEEIKELLNSQCFIHEKSVEEAVDILQLREYSYTQEQAQKAVQKFIDDFDATIIEESIKDELFIEIVGKVG